MQAWGHIIPWSSFLEFQGVHLALKFDRPSCSRVLQIWIMLGLSVLHENKECKICKQNQASKNNMYVHWLTIVYISDAAAAANIECRRCATCNLEMSVVGASHVSLHIQQISYLFVGEFWLQLAPLENALASWGKPERAAHCADLYHGTQAMNSSMVCDCLLSVRAAIMATHTWTKFTPNSWAESGAQFVHGPYLKRLQPPCVSSVSNCPPIGIKVVRSQRLACKTNK